MIDGKLKSLGFNEQRFRILTALNSVLDSCQSVAEGSYQNTTKLLPLGLVVVQYPKKRNGRLDIQWRSLGYPQVVWQFVCVEKRLALLQSHGQKVDCRPPCVVCGASC